MKYYVSAVINIKFSRNIEKIEIKFFIQVEKLKHQWGDTMMKDTKKNIYQ